MKEVIIKRMKLVNFKGLRDFEVEFNGSVTSILGKNGSGKTTIFDAFTWLLFGKDSEDRKAFNIKTLGSDGKAIEKLPHEVSAVLTVNGEEITLCRRFNESWVRRKGSSKEEFDGHNEERLFNDVPMKVNEWKEKINSICAEEVFKFITNPAYFSAQRSEVQRAMLFDMAGTISDEEIAFGNDDFQRLLGKLTGKTMEEYKKEVASKKRTIKAEIDGIPERIDERKRDMPTAENWDKLNDRLSELLYKELPDVEGQIDDKAKAYKAASDERVELSKRLAEIKTKSLNRQFKIKEDVQAEYRQQYSKQQELFGKVDLLQNERKRVASDLKDAENELEGLKSKRESLLKEWKEITARKLVFDEKEFVCPTCGRQFEIDDIEHKQDEMKAKFNQRKAADLEAVNTKGNATTSRIGEVEATIKKCNEKISEIDGKIETLKSDPLFNATLVAPDATDAIKNDEEYKGYQAEISELEAKIAEPVEIPDTEELKQRKAGINSEVDDLKLRLGKRETIEKNNSRIKELEDQLKRQNDELAELEGIEYTMQEFSKARINMVESRINGLFSIVKFKMFEQQINGGEAETCEATVDGVPYSDLNNAMKINAGLDIINAICTAKGVVAPIFIDNAESINELMQTKSQMIRLVVTDDPTLVIK